MAFKYFGVNLRDKKFGLKMTRENYAIVDKKCSTHSHNFDYYETFWGEDKKEEFLKIFEDTSATTYSDSWCKNKKKEALKNYDLNIKYFKSLDNKDFKLKVEELLINNNKLKEIRDINVADQKSGYYIMVLDEYCQIYVGTSKNIKVRIMSHWSRKKEFDRLIFGAVETSKLSIDSFRALDTTRIFAYFTNDTYSLEDNFINKIPKKYCCNRTSGGIPTFGKLSIIANSKKREFMKE